MKKAWLTLFAALTVVTAGAGPALAQPYGGPPPGGYHPDGDRGYGPPRPGAYRHDDGQRGGWDIDRRIQWIQERVDRARDDRSLDRREYFRVQRELNSIRGQEDQFRRYHGGRLDDRARGELQDRLDRLNGQIHWLRQHDDRRPW